MHFQDQPRLIQQAINSLEKISTRLGTEFLDLRIHLCKPLANCSVYISAGCLIEMEFDLVGCIIKPRPYGDPAFTQILFQLSRISFV